jgi:tRNA (uracil-5-)-methyltransferase TRM9
MEGRGICKCLATGVSLEQKLRAVVKDFTISVAAIHHLSTPERRRHAVQALLPPLLHRSNAPYSRFLIYVWAYEQSTLSKRKMGATATATVDPTAAAGEQAQLEEAQRIQDVLVPWVMGNKRIAARPVKNGPFKGRRSGDKEENKISADKPTVEAENDVPALVVDENKEEEPKVFHRYYHLFVEGELRELVQEAAREEGYMLLPERGEAVDPEQEQRGDGARDATTAGEKWLRIRGVGYEADNWWLEGEVGVGSPSF